MSTENTTPKEENASPAAANCSAKIDAATQTREALSVLFSEQVIGMRDDINEQAEKLFFALYDEGAKRAMALLMKYAPRKHGLSSQLVCPACNAWWPRHENTCEIAQLISPNGELADRTS